MSANYVQQRSLEALGLTRNEFGENDWGEASRLLADWAREDQRLLLALAAPYLNGAAANHIQQTARSLGKTTVLPKPGRSNSPANANKANLGGGMWEVIAHHLQDDMVQKADPVAHKQAMRSLAKAFAAKRLDARLAARPNTPIK